MAKPDKVEQLKPEDKEKPKFETTVTDADVEWTAGANAPAPAPAPAPATDPVPPVDVRPPPSKRLNAELEAGRKALERKYSPAAKKAELEKGRK